MITPRESFLRQAEACRSMGSPFTAIVCEILADTLSRETKFGTRILEWTNDPIEDALPLRTAGALNWLARQGSEPNITRPTPQPQPPTCPSQSLKRSTTTTSS